MKILPFSLRYTKHEQILQPSSSVIASQATGDGKIARSSLVATRTMVAKGLAMRPQGLDDANDENIAV
jgi:hypothetical protein